MRSGRQKLGDAGERLAALYLESRSYRLLARQAGIPRVGEIDLVMYDPAGEIVFVEVKTRHDRQFGPPEEAVTVRKLRRMMRVAEAWRVRHGLYDRPWRVDVVAIELTGPKPVIRHLQGVTLD